MHVGKRVVDRGCRVLFLAPTGALVHSYLDRLPDSESIFVDAVHGAMRFSRQRDAELSRCNPPSRLQLFDVIFLDEVSMLEEHVCNGLVVMPDREVQQRESSFAGQRAERWSGGWSIGEEELDHFSVATHDGGVERRVAFAIRLLARCCVGRHARKEQPHRSCMAVVRCQVER